MKAYNSRIIPRTQSKTDRLYISDIEQITPARYPNDKKIRTTIEKFKKTGKIYYRDKIIAWFGKYVISIAKNYQEQGLPLSDLISEGVIGIIAAVDQFDTKGATKFVTYSNTCISRQMREALDQTNRPVKVPKNIRNHQIKTWGRLHKHSLEGKDITETIEESSQHEKIFVINPKAYHRKQLKRFHSEQNIKENPLEDHMLLSEEFYTKLDHEDLIIDIDRVLSLLTDLEKTIIQHFYGLKENDPCTIPNISVKLGVSLDQVRKLKQSGLEKLRDKKSLEILGKYL